MHSKDKPSSLLRIFVNYGRKKFYNIGPWRNKLECYSNVSGTHTLAYWAISSDTKKISVVNKAYSQNLFLKIVIHKTNKRIILNIFSLNLGKDSNKTSTYYFKNFRKNIFWKFCELPLLS